MAELDVQPRQKSSAVPWIIAGLVLLVLLFLLARGCNGDTVNTEESKLSHIVHNRIHFKAGVQCTS